MAAIESVDEGYSMFNNYSQARIKYLGPAFFTELLYFHCWTSYPIGHPSPSHPE